MVIDRCGDCEGEQEAEVSSLRKVKGEEIFLSSKVCGSDGKTYSSACELENYACRKYWDIKIVSQVDLVLTV